MGRSFNITGACNPRLHYMVDIQKQLEEIKKMVDSGAYFTINRARQYGKTTTLRALAYSLKNDYVVLSLDFQKISSAAFEDEHIFSISFTNYLLRTIRNRRRPVEGLCSDVLDQLDMASKTDPFFSLGTLFAYLSDLCDMAQKPVVLMIDEVDSAADNQVFLDFLAQLRGYYLTREETPIFQSAILASVYDVKSIKQKIRPEDEHKWNSPWNIAADFDVAMSFSKEGIAGMLIDYENDNRTGMDVEEMAGLIYDYTMGYPFLVSRICKLLDEKITDGEGGSKKDLAWTKEGFLKAINCLLTEPNTLFDSLFGKLDDYPELTVLLNDLLFKGKEIPYILGEHAVEVALRFGFVRKSKNCIVIANRIFETLLYNLFLASAKMQQEEIYDVAIKDKNQFIKDGRLDMKLVLEKFVTHFDEIYGDRGQTFYEDDGRRYFLLYLRPIINGVGNYYIEAQTRNRERTDVVVDYGGEQVVVELKIWRGDTYNTRGEKQLLEYLNYYHLSRGYMLSFNFNKNKHIGVKEILLGNMVLVEAVV